MKLTPWFDAQTQRPVRAGWYDYAWVERPRRVQRLWWSGRGWGYTQHTIYALSVCDGDKWRGVMQDTPSEV